MQLGYEAETNWPMVTPGSRPRGAFAPEDQKLLWSSERTKVSFTLGQVHWTPHCPYWQVALYTQPTPKNDTEARLLSSHKTEMFSPSTLLESLKDRDGRFQASKRLKVLVFQDGRNLGRGRKLMPSPCIYGLKIYVLSKELIWKAASSEWMDGSKPAIGYAEGITLQKSGFQFLFRLVTHQGVWVCTETTSARTACSWNASSVHSISHISAGSKLCSQRSAPECEDVKTEARICQK